MKLKTLLASAFVFTAIFGAAAFAHATSYPLGGQTYYLAGAGVTATQNTIQLTSFETPDGTPVTMTEIGTIGYGALGVGTSKLEDVSFTGITQNSNGTATLTGVVRGVEFNFPYSQSITLEISHAGGSTFTVTNTAQFYYNEFAMPNNSNDFTWPTASSSISTKGYTDFVGSGGANIIPATFIAQGVSQLGTSAQTASSTVQGSTGFNLVIPSQIATDTPTAKCNSAGSAIGAGCVPVAGLNGQISSLFVPTPVLASTTFIGSTAALAIGKNEFATSTSGTWTVPSGITKVWVRMVGGGGASGNSSSAGCTSGGGSGGYAEFMLSVSNTLAMTIGSGGATTTNTGGTGGATIVGGVTANGGAGGNVNVSPPSSSGGGAGGTVTGATMGTMATSTGTQGGSCVNEGVSGGTFQLNGLGATSVLGIPGGGGIGGGGGSLFNGTAGNPGEVILTY